MTTTTTTVPVSELSGPALDWAVAKCEHLDVVFLGKSVHVQVPRRGMKTNYEKREYSSNWSLAGPIIERERMCIDSSTDGTHWLSSSRSNEKGNLYKGSTPLEAAMRSHVASKLGNAVDVPSELV